MVYWISKPKHLSMDFPSLPSFTFCLALIFFLLVLVAHKKGKEAASKLPPGPWKLPIIGSLHHLLTPLLHRRLRELAMEYGPLMHLMMGEVSTVVASSTDAAQEILKTHDVAFADRPHVRTAQIITYDYRDMIFAPYGKYWRQVKKLCILELLTVKRVESFVAVREEEVSNLVRTISSSCGSTINLSKLLRELTTDVTARAAFGKKSKMKEMFVEAIKEVNKAGAGFDPSDIFPSFSWLFAVFFGSKSKMEEIFGKVDGIITSIVEERMKMGSKNREGGGEEEDFLDVLLRMQRCNDLEVPLACDNVKAIVMDMFSAGTETSSTLLCWVIAELIKNPAVMAKAQAEVRQALIDIGDKVSEKPIQHLTYMKCVIKETLRLHPPLPLLLPRQCRQSTTICGYNIPAKTKVIVNAWAIGRDPSRWGDDAECFRPERFMESSIDFGGASFEFIPFGAGRRMCPAICFGLATVELPLAYLLYHFDWALPGGICPKDVDMTEAFGTSVSLKSDLLLIPTRTTINIS